MKIILASVLIIFFYLIRDFKASSATLNDRPIIGILSQELSKNTRLKYPGKNSYIAASYVKFVEGAGGRAVPIFIGKEQKYYEDILRKVNGVLLPGGSVYFNNTNGYGVAGEKIFKIILDMNANGIYMPIWGTCLGFELLTFLAAHNIEHRIECSSQSQSIPLHFENNFRNSRLFKNIPQNILWTLEKKNSTINFHRYCITKSAFKKLKLYKNWRIMSVSYDWNNVEFISTIEHKTYPIYGVQFHPEKNIYEFIKNRNISHKVNVIAASQYFANFFVNETRHNTNSFASDSEETDSLIYNYSPSYSGKKGLVFEQAYYFD